MRMKLVVLTTLTLSLAGCISSKKDLVTYPALLPPASDTVEIQIVGHVKKPGLYRVRRHLTQTLPDLINLAGGFSPLPEFASDGVTSVAWIERELPKHRRQLIILDYRNKIVLSQRTLEEGKLRNERYRWQDFRFSDRDMLFVTTSRRSLDLTGYSIRGVAPTGWPGIEKLRLFGMSAEETKTYEDNHKP